MRDTDNAMEALRDVARTFLSGTKAEVQAALRDIEKYIVELEPEVEVAVTEAIAATEADRQTWVDTLAAQVDAVALRTLRKAKSISRATEKRIRDATLGVLQALVRLAT